MLNFISWKEFLFFLIIATLIYYGWILGTAKLKSLKTLYAHGNLIRHYEIISMVTSGIYTSRKTHPSAGKMTLKKKTSKNINNSKNSLTKYRT